MLEQGIRLLASFTVGVWMARFLGPATFGQYSLVIAVLGVGYSVSKLGMDTILMRFFVEKTSPLDYVMPAIVIRLCCAFLFMLLVLLASNLLSIAEDFQHALIIVVLSLFFNATEVFEFFALAKGKGELPAFAKMVSVLIASVVRVCLILQGAPMIAFLAVVVLEHFLVGLILWLFFRKWSPNLRLNNANVHNKVVELIVQSFPVFLGALVVSIYMRLDQFMLEYFLGSQSVGVYSAAIKFSEVWFVLPMIFSNALYPAIINAKKEKAGIYKFRMTFLYSIVFWSLLAACVLTTYFSEILVFTLYGEEFSEAAGVIRIHIWSTLFAGLMIVGGKWYVSEGLTSQLLFRHICALAANISLNFLLIPRLGIYGAAVSTLASYIFAGYLCDLYGRSSREQFRLKTLAILRPWIILRGNI